MLQRIVTKTLPLIRGKNLTTFTPKVKTNLYFYYGKMVQYGIGVGALYGAGYGIYNTEKMIPIESDFDSFEVVSNISTRIVITYGYTVYYILIGGLLGIYSPILIVSSPFILKNYYDKNKNKNT